MVTRVLSSIETAPVQSTDVPGVSASVDGVGIPVTPSGTGALTFNAKDLVAAIQAGDAMSRKQPNTHHKKIGLSNEQMERATGFNLGASRLNGLRNSIVGASRILEQVMSIESDITKVYGAMMKAISRMKDDEIVHLTPGHENVVMQFITKHYKSGYNENLSSMCPFLQSQYVPEEVMYTLICLRSIYRVSSNKTLTVGALMQEIDIEWKRTTNSVIFISDSQGKHIPVYQHDAFSIDTSTGRTGVARFQTDRSLFDLKETTRKVMAGPPVFVQLRKILPPKDIIPAQHMMWIEEICIYGGHALTIIPYKALAVAFIQKHRGYLSLNQHLIPESWGIEDSLLQTLLYPPKSENTPKQKEDVTPKKAQGMPTPSVETIDTIVPPQPLEAPLIRPIVNQEQMSYLKTSFKFKPIASKLVTNFPSYAVLWIGISPVGSLDDQIVWSRYSRMDRVILRKPTEVTQYIFTFAGPNDPIGIPPTHTPRITQILEPEKIEKLPIQFPEVRTGVQDNTNRVLTPESPVKEKISNPGDDIALMILDELSHISSGSLYTEDRLFFLRCPQTPTVIAQYDPQTEIITLNGVDEAMHVYILSIIEHDLRQVFQGEVMKHIDYLNTIVSTQLHYLTGGSNTVSPTAIMKELYTSLGYIGGLWLSDANNPNWKNIVLEYKQKYDLDIDLMKDRLVLKTGPIYGSREVTICSRKESPYYMITSGDNHLTDESDYLFILAKNMSALIGVSARELGIIGEYNNNIQKTSLKKPKWNKKEIRDILTGKYTGREWDDIDKEEKSRIRELINRISGKTDRKDWKQLKNSKDSITGGYTTYSIVRHKEPIDDITTLTNDTVIVGTDVKISTLSKGQGNEIVYDILLHDERMRKYWCRRMINAANGRNDDGKTGFTNGGLECFNAFWYGKLSPEVREQFVGTISIDQDGYMSGTGKCLALILDATSEQTVFDAYIQFMKADQIELCYTGKNGKKELYSRVGSLPLSYSRPVIYFGGELAKYAKDIENEQSV